MASRKITSITKEAKRDLSLDEIESALVKGFQDTLQTTLKDGDITQHEHHLAKTLFETKYATPDWNLYGKNMENE
jgi:lipoate-protein ligase A